MWKLTQIPQPIEGNTTMAGGILMQPTLAASVAAASDAAPASAEVQKILAELQKLDQESPPPTAPAARLTEYNAKRADILSRLVSASSTEEERNQWMRQMIDSIASAVQIGAYTEGLARLKSLEADLRRSSPKSPMVPYIAYRRLLADYASQHQTSSSSKQQEIQKWWRGELEKFTKEYPTADDTPEALLQLAIAQEFIGQIPEAKHWYGELADRYPQTKPGRRAAGALRRLDLKGKPFDFAGPALGDGHSINARDYRGKVLLVAYWSTWCTACTQDLPVLRALYDQDRSKGLEIVGVSLDVTADPVEPFLKQNKVTWPQIFQPGGTESEPASAFGVIVPPLMILVDRLGKSRDRHHDDRRDQIGGSGTHRRQENGVAPLVGQADFGPLRSRQRQLATFLTQRTLDEAAAVSPARRASARHSSSPAGIQDRHRGAVGRCDGSPGGERPAGSDLGDVLRGARDTLAALSTAVVGGKRKRSMLSDVNCSSETASSMPIRSDPGPHEGRQHGPAPQTPADVAADRSHVRARAAVDRQLEFRVRKPRELEPEDVDLPRRELDVFPLAGQLVRSDSVDVNGRKVRRDLPDPAAESRQQPPRSGRA